MAKKKAVVKKRQARKKSVEMPGVWSISWDRNDAEEIAKRRRDNDAAVASAAHQFAAACAVLLDRTGMQCREELANVLEGVLVGAAEKLSFNKPKGTCESC